MERELDLKYSPNWVKIFQCVLFLFWASVSSLEMSLPATIRETLSGAEILWCCFQGSPGLESKRDTKETPRQDGFGRVGSNNAETEGGTEKG